MRRNHLLIPSAVLFLLVSEVAAQNSPGITQEAKSSPCSNVIALTGDVKIDCSSLTPAQQKIIDSIPALLRNIIAHQHDADAVIAKLDECLKAANPNVPHTVYSCKGQSRTEKVNAGGGTEWGFNQNPDPSAPEMAKLLNARQFPELLEVCISQIESKPEWLTPRLFCASAYRGLGDATKAKEMLAFYDAQKGPGYDGDPDCKQLSDLK